MFMINVKNQKSTNYRSFLVDKSVDLCVGMIEINLCFKLRAEVEVPTTTCQSFKKFYTE